MASSPAGATSRPFVRRRMPDSVLLGCALFGRMANNAEVGLPHAR